MCGASSALGLAEAERTAWPVLRNRLRQPGRLMGLMRGVLGGDAEVAVAVATTPDGVTQPLAILVTPAIAAELTLAPDAQPGTLARASVGEYDVEVVLDELGQPVALLVNTWIFEHLTVYARKLWVRH